MSIGIIALGSGENASRVVLVTLYQSVLQQAAAQLRLLPKDFHNNSRPNWGEASDLRFRKTFRLLAYQSTAAIARFARAGSAAPEISRPRRPVGRRL